MLVRFLLPNLAQPANTKCKFSRHNILFIEIHAVNSNVGTIYHLLIRTKLNNI